MKPLQKFNNEGVHPSVGEKPDLTTFDGPGTGTSDSIPAELPEQGFVITAAAMQMFGPDFFKSLIAAVPVEPTSEESGEPQPVDVKVSDGEGYIPPEVVEFYGADFFEKVNAAASGGEAEGPGEMATDPQEPMEGEEAMGPMVGEEKDEMNCGGKVKGYARGGGILSGGGSFNSGVTQPNRDDTQIVTASSADAPVTANFDKMPGDFDRSNAAPVKSSSEQVMQGQRDFGAKIDSITSPERLSDSAKNIVGGGVAQGVGAVAQGSENLMRGTGNLVDTASNGFSKIGEMLNPVDAAQGIARNVGNIVAGSDNVKAINANPEVGQVRSNLDAAGNAAWEGAKERATMGNGLVGLAAAPVNAIQKGIQAFNDNDQYQKTMAAEAARKDPNSPSYAGASGNSPDYKNPEDVKRMTLVNPGQAQPQEQTQVSTEGKKSLVGNANEKQTKSVSFNDEPGAYQTLKAARDRGQKLDAPLVDFMQQYEAKNNIVSDGIAGSIQKSQVGLQQPTAEKGVATRARKQVAKDYQVGEADKPWPLTAQFPGDDRAPDLSRERNPNNPLPYGLATYGEKKLPDGSYEDVFGTRMWKDPAGIVKNKNGTYTSGYVDIDGKPLLVPSPGTNSVDINDFEHAIPGARYIGVVQPSDDPRRQISSVAYLEPEKNVINLSGDPNWNRGTTAADREWMKQHPRKVDPWFNDTDKMIANYQNGQGAQHEQAMAAQKNAQTAAKEVSNNNANKQAELKARADGSYFRKHDPENGEGGEKVYQKEDGSFDIQPSVGEIKAEKRKAALRKQLASNPNAIDLSDPLHQETTLELMQDSEFRRTEPGKRLAAFLANRRNNKGAQ